MSTEFPSKNAIARTWHVVDAEDQVPFLRLDLEDRPERRQQADEHDLAPALADPISPAILAPSFIGELSLCLWLLAKGVDTKK